MSQDLPGLFDDDANPYAAPAERVEHWNVRGKEGTSRVEFEIGDLFGRAWAIYKREMWLCIGVVLCGFVIGIVAQIPARVGIPLLMAADAGPLVTIPLAVVGVLVFVLLQVWIQAGMTLFMLNVAKGRNPSFTDLFAGGPYLWPSLWAGFLLLLILGALVALGFIPYGLAITLAGGPDARTTTVPVAIGIGVFTGLIGTVIAGVRFSQYTYLIVDQRARGLGSLQQSIEVTHGKSLLLFVMFFLCGLLYISGFFACYIGALFTASYSLVVISVMYLALTGQPVADPEASWHADLPELKPLAPDDPLAEPYLPELRPLAPDDPFAEP